jgi:hypothetical protein
MKKHALALSFFALSAACGGEARPPDALPNAGGGVSGSTGVAAGAGAAATTSSDSSGGGPPSAAGSGGTTAGQAGAAGTAVGGAAAGAPGAAGAGQTAGAGGTGGSATLTFECSQLTGPNVAGEWFAAGFEDAVGSARWQVKAPHHSFVEDWANPSHDVWRDADCQGTYTNCEVESVCEKPLVDRVLFVTQTGDYLGTAQATWESLIESALTTLKAKYPALERVELLTFVRAPNGQDCGSETTVSPMLDAAQQAVAAGSNGFVTVGPHLTASACASFSGSPHMTAPGNAEVAQQLAQHYRLP